MKCDRINKFLTYLNEREVFLIHENGQFRTSWDIFVIVLSLWICFALPFEVAFEPPGLESMLYRGMNYFFDIIFIIDILLNFRTTISDFITGEEITDSKKIAIKYLKGRFILDVLAAIPFEMISYT
jgi:hypothetical protein